MKFIIGVLLALSSVSAFALEKDLLSTLKKIETENNAKCTETKRSRFEICTGAMISRPDLGTVYENGLYKTCRYSIKYNCVSNTGDFDVKLKIVESYSSRAQMRVANVRKIIYYKTK